MYLPSHVLFIIYLVVRGGSRPFRIVSELNAKVVDIQARSPAPDAKALLWSVDPGHGVRNQLWYLDSEGYIRSSLNDFVFTNKGWYTE